MNRLGRTLALGSGLVGLMALSACTGEVLSVVEHEAGTQPPSSEAGTPASCDDNGVTYGDGAEWACEDSCNRCACHNGIVSYTRVECDGGSAEGPSCVENGVAYASGTSWACGTGCSTCTCSYGTLTVAAALCGLMDGGSAADATNGADATSGADADADVGAGCIYGGVLRQGGTAFPCSDGCNLCFCENGEVGQANFRDDWSCLADSGFPSCFDNGVIHESGTTWLSADGCNGLACNLGMVVSLGATCGGSPVTPCVENGMTHTNSQEWTCGNGCTCECFNGDIGGTLDHCAPEAGADAGP